MIIGEKFVWTHLGKTAGNSVKEMFDVIDRCYTFADDISDIKKHYNFRIIREKRENIDGKKRILNIRPLPEWIISYVMHKKTYENIDFYMEEILNGQLRIKPHFYDDNEKLQQHQQIKFITPDAMMNQFEPEDVDYWLRTTHLTEDFVRVMSNFTQINLSENVKIHNIRSNVNIKNTFKPHNFFTKANIEQLYDKCPIWTKYEKQVFGSLAV